VSPYASGNSELALEVAATYQEIGMLYQYGYRERALHAFTNAALLLAGIATGDPSAGPYRTQWIALADLIRALGGDVPSWVPQPTPRTQVAAVANATAHRQAAVSEPVGEVPSPSAPPPAEPVNRAEYDEARRLFIHATSSVGTAEEVMRQLQAGAAREGQIVHSDVTQKVNNMRAALDMARQDLDSGSLSAARENILAAETYAARVIKSGGGR
jgi:hypothetical protein